ncbi:MAG: cbb3-type cytochrome c oxidase subunit I, partial [Acidimicrobiales bacterium]
FPRAAAAAFWTWLVGMGIHVATVFVDGGLGYPLNPVAAAQGTDPEAIELSLLSMGMVALAVMLASICIMTTIIAQRPQGMSLYEVPLFSWSMLVAGSIWLLALPVWVANLAIAWVDFGGDDSQRYGNVANIWDQVAWLWSQPMVFAFAIPVLGIVGEIIPVAANKGQRFYSSQQTAIAVFGLLTFGAWAQPAFNSEVSHQALFVTVSLLLVVPLLVFAGGLADTLAKSRPALTGHFLLALLAFITLLVGATVAALQVLGAAIGVVREIDSGWLQEVIEPLEDLRGTVLATGAMQQALFTAVIGGIAGLYYWAPKIFGRRLNGSVGILAGLALLGGTLLSGLANVINGFLDEGDDVFRPEAYSGVWDSDAVELFNIIGFAGAILLLVGIVLVLVDVIVSVGLGRGDTEDVDDPWLGHTLEWATTSPPPVGNFAEAPVVTSERPLLDRRREVDT